MPQYSQNFQWLVDIDPLVREIFYQSYNEHPTTSDVIYAVRPSTKSKETDQLVGSFGDPKVFTGKVDYDEAKPDYEVVYRHIPRTNGFIVERELIDDKQYSTIFDRAEELAISFSRWEEKDKWGILNTAFTGGDYAGYDGQPLCSDSHPRSNTDSNTVDNALALPLSQDNLETAIITMQAFGNDRGEEISIVPDLLIVPRAQRKTAHELTESEWTPEDANTASNVHYGMRYIVVPWLTNPNAWFVVDTTYSKRWLKWYNRIPVEFDLTFDFNTQQRKYMGYMRNSRGWSNWRWIIGSTG